MKVSQIDFLIADVIGFEDYMNYELMHQIMKMVFHQCI